MGQVPNITQNFSRPSYRPDAQPGMDPDMRRMAIVAGGIGAAVALVIGAVSLSHRGHHGVPVIEAAAGPVRVKPLNPGGMQVAGAEDAAGGVEALAPAAEKPALHALHARTRQAAAHTTQVAEPHTPITPAPAMAQVAPVQRAVADLTPADRVAEAGRNVIAAIHDGIGGDADAALATSAVTVSGTWRTQRVSHAQLETHGTLGWIDEQQRLVLRTSSQVPFLVRDEICVLLGLPRDRVRVLTARVGGGFGGKQEILTEDLVALAVMRTGKPVSFEMSRHEEFVRTTVRHPMQVEVTLGATSGGALTAIKVGVLSDTGAYGNHSIGVLYHGCAESISLYNCPVKRLGRRGRLHQQHPVGRFPRLRARAGDPRASSRRWTSWPWNWTWIPSSCAGSMRSRTG